MEKVHRPLISLAPQGDSHLFAAFEGGPFNAGRLPTHAGGNAGHD